MNTVIQKPLNAPPRTPIIRHSTIDIIIGLPDSTSQPKAQAESPIIEATERSISALMIINTITRAIIIFSIDNSKIFIWLSMLRKDSELNVFTTIIKSKIKLRNPSQLFSLLYIIFIYSFQK